MLSLHTPLCARLGIDLPLVQAPIGSASTPELAAAVSNAGGLGMLSLTWRDLDEARTLLRRTKALTERPFGVNLVLRWPPDEKLALCLDEGVGLVSFFWGDPTPYVRRVHDAGSLVAHTVASADEARRALGAGVDVLVAQGWEAGGHVWGEVGTIALVPRVVDASGGLPVIAAGGIGDGRGVAAALALGADGAWLGTRFLLADEAAIHPQYRALLQRAVETDTLHTSLFDGGWPDAPHRVLRNATTDAWEAAGSPPPGARPGEGETIARYADGDPVERYSSNLPRPEVSGDIDAMCLYAGQSVGLASERLPATQIVAQLAAETRAALGRLSSAGPAPGS